MLTMMYNDRQTPPLSVLIEIACNSFIPGLKSPPLNHHFIDDNPMGFAKTHDGLGFERLGQVGLQKSRGAKHVENKRDVAGIPGIIQLLQVPDGLSCHVHDMAVDLGRIFPGANMVGINSTAGKGSDLVNHAGHVFQ